MLRKSPSTRNDFDTLAAAARERSSERYLLSLYVTGTTSLSNRAIVNIRKICEEHLQGRYELKVVDVSQNPALASSEQVIAAPTLIKKLPLPLRRFIGDMSQTDRILVGLDLRKLGERSRDHG